MAQQKIVHIVGTGTIGEPLIGILSTFKEQFGIDEITFHKRTPLVTDRLCACVEPAMREAADPPVGGGAFARLEQQLETLTLAELRRFSPRFDREALRRLTPEAAIARRRAPGGTARDNVERRLEKIGV